MGRVHIAIPSIPFIQISYYRAAVFETVSFYNLYLIINGRGRVSELKLNLSLL